MLLGAAQSRSTNDALEELSGVHKCYQTNKRFEAAVTSTDANTRLSSSLRTATRWVLGARGEC